MIHQRRKLLEKVWRRKPNKRIWNKALDEINFKDYLEINELAFEMGTTSRHLNSNPNYPYVFKKQFPMYLFGENRELRFDE